MIQRVVPSDAAHSGWLGGAPDLNEIVRAKDRKPRIGARLMGATRNLGHRTQPAVPGSSGPTPKRWTSMFWGAGSLGLLFHGLDRHEPTEYNAFGTEVKSPRG